MQFRKKHNSYSCLPNSILEINEDLNANEADLKNQNLNQKHYIQAKQVPQSCKFQQQTNSNNQPNFFITPNKIVLTPKCSSTTQDSFLIQQAELIEALNQEKTPNKLQNDPNWRKTVANLLTQKSLFDKLFVSNKNLHEKWLISNQGQQQLRQNLQKQNQSYIFDVAQKLSCSNSVQSLNTSFYSLGADKIKPFDQSKLLQKVREKKKLKQQSCVLDRQELNFLNQNKGNELSQLKHFDKSFKQSYNQVMTELETSQQKQFINLYQKFNSIDRKQNIGDPETNNIRFAEKSFILYNDSNKNQNIANTQSNISIGNNNNGQLNNVSLNVSSQQQPQFSMSSISITNQNSHRQVVLDESQSQIQALNQTQYVLLNTSQQFKRNFQKLQCQHLLPVMYCQICNRKVQSVPLSTVLYQNQLNQSIMHKMQERDKTFNPRNIDSYNSSRR